MDGNADAGKVTTTMKRQELLRAIRAIARHSEFDIGRAFEETGCSCQTDREELRRLEREREESLREATKEIEATLGKRITELRQRVWDTDLKEHPQLHAAGHRAWYFFALWLMERLADGDADIFDQDREARAKRFAEAWLTGWRPSLPE